MQTTLSLPVLTENAEAGFAPRTGPVDIDAETMIPDLLRAAPHLRAVFDRYGLRGCGGPLGPAESIGYFARVHGVDLASLHDELRAEDQKAAIDPQSAGEAAWASDDPADSIYRRFFKSGIFVVLTAGAVWGAYLLWQIALSSSFTAISIHDVNAHGHAQIFGWVGLFVMGFAYQAFPRMRHTTLAHPRVALLTLPLMLGGIIARTIGEPLHEIAAMRAAAVAGAISEIVAIALFAFIIVRTVRRSGHPASWLDGYVFASIAFFFIQAVYETGLLLATTAAPTRDALLQIVATWQGPLRDIQIHGFAMLMILGVGLKMFAPLFDFPAPSPRLVRNGLFLLLVAIVAEVAFFLLMRTTGSRAWTGGLYAANLLLAGTAMALTWGWLPRRGEASGDRSRKFVHVSAAWLYVSMAMLLLAPLYMFVLLPAAPWRSVSGEQAVAMGFSHAYYGAVRHAITVGFISLMILGMAAKVIPTLNGVDIRTLRPLWLPFALVNLGCLLRVSLQIATDLAPRAYPLVGVSGVLEVTGIAIWGVHLWRIMNGWNPAVGAAAAPRPARISPEDAPGRVVEWFPATLPVFLRYGLTPLANPLLRRTLGRGVTLRTAAAMRGIALAELVRDLNEAIESPQGRPVG